MVVAIDNVEEPVGGTHHWDGAADTHAHTLGSISDGCVVVIFTIDRQAVPMPTDGNTTCTIDGVAATLVASVTESSDLMKTMMWIRATGSTSGDVDVVITLNDTSYDISTTISTISFKDVDQTTPFENAATSTDGNSDNDTNLAISSATGDMTVDGLGSRGTGGQTIVSGDPTERHNDVQNSHSSATSTAPGATSTDHDWTNPGGRTAQVGCSIRAAAGGPTEGAAEAIPVDIKPAEIAGHTTAAAEAIPVDIKPSEIAFASEAIAEVVPIDVAPREVQFASEAGADTIPIDVSPREVAFASEAASEAIPIDVLPQEVALSTSAAAAVEIVIDIFPNEVIRSGFGAAEEVIISIQPADVAFASEAGAGVIPVDIQPSEVAFASEAAAGEIFIEIIPAESQFASVGAAVELVVDIAPATLGHLSQGFPEAIVVDVLPQDVASAATLPTPRKFQVKSKVSQTHVWKSQIDKTHTWKSRMD